MARRKPRPLTRARLGRYADWYLERWSATRASLHRALWRRAHKVLREHPHDELEVGVWIDEAIAERVRMGLVNDRRYAEDVLRSHRRRGVSERQTRSKLRVKGVDGALIDELFAQTDPERELRSAAKYARRRRLGPYRRKPIDREGRAKELAKFGRAGFSFDIAAEVVDASDPSCLPEH